MTNRCPYCGTGDWCQCALDHPEDRQADEKVDWRKDPVERAKVIGRARRALEQIPDLAPFLPLVLVRRGMPDGPMAGSFGSRPPMDLDVVDLLDGRDESYGVQPRLIDWIRIFDDALEGTIGYQTPWRRQACCAACAFEVSGFVVVGRDGAPQGCCVGDLRQHPHIQRTVSEACSWLLTYLERAAEYQWFDEFDTDIRKMRGELKAKTRDRGVEDLGLSCLKCGWAGIVPVQAERGKWYRCTGCDESWPEATLSKWAERKRPRPLKECAAMSGVPHRTLRYLVAEGRLKHVARLGNANLYYVQDAVVAAALVKIRGSETTPA